MSGALLKQRFCYKMVVNVKIETTILSRFFFLFSTKKEIVHYLSSKAQNSTRVPRSKTFLHRFKQVLEEKNYPGVIQ